MGNGAKATIGRIAVALVIAAAAGSAAANENIARKNACMSCHSIDKKVVGPAFKDVAKELAKESAKKAGAGEARALKAIQTGSRGVWSAVPMPPMKQIAGEDANILAKWLAEGAKR